MALSKNLTIMRALIEELLVRRHNESNRPTLEELQIGTKLLNVMLPEGRVYVVTDSYRIAEHFARAVKRQFTHFNCIEKMQGIENIHIVVLHTGQQTPVQYDIRTRIMDYVRSMRDITVWHIGDWA
jgi:hypothetical protein